MHEPESIQDYGTYVVFLGSKIHIYIPILIKRLGIVSIKKKKVTCLHEDCPIPFDH